MGPRNSEVRHPRQGFLWKEPWPHLPPVHTCILMTNSWFFPPSINTRQAGFLSTLDGSGGSSSKSGFVRSIHVYSCCFCSCKSQIQSISIPFECLTWQVGERSCGNAWEPRICVPASKFIPEQLKALGSQPR